MAYNELFNLVKITPEGAISMGDVLVCDGFEKGHMAAAFTHIHHDHMGNSFGTCMHNYPVYVSKITGDLLRALTGDNYIHRTQLRVIDYESDQDISTENGINYLRLIESSHVLGASQILLHTSKDIKILYSGDISPNDHPHKCDVLVVDSTHGSLHFNKQIDSRSLERRLVEAVIDSLDKKKPVCVHAHRGKLQQLMSVLSCHPNMPSGIKFLTDEIDARVASIYCRYGAQIKDLVTLDTYEGEEIICSDYPWIEFRSTMRRTLKEERQVMTRVTVSGSFGTSTIRQNGEELWVASDEHAELDGLLKYVKNADPKIVVTDNSHRTKMGHTLAKIVSEELGIPSKPMP